MACSHVIHVELLQPTCQVHLGKGHTTVRLQQMSACSLTGLSSVAGHISVAVRSSVAVHSRRRGTCSIEQWHGA